tara:strand:- start:627 stop:812 length:186 start_codon:yes stop_codon:yes gene_type:complete
MRSVEELPGAPGAQLTEIIKPKKTPVSILEFRSFTRPGPRAPNSSPFHQIEIGGYRGVWEF